jgi:hypothetical protein
MRSGSAPRWHLNKMLVHRSSSCCRDVSGSNGTLNGSLCSCLSISSEFIPHMYSSLDVRSATITAGGFMPNPGMLHRLVKLARWVLSLSLSPIEYALSSEQRSLATPSNTHSYNNRYSDAMHRRPGSHASPVRTRSIPRAGVLQVSRRSGSRQLVYTRTTNAGTTRRNA